MDSYLSKYNIEDSKKYLSIVLAFLVLILSLMYIYLVNNSVLNTVAREQNIKEISKIVLNISSLENSYIRRKSDLNIDMAYSLGFKDDFSKVHFSSDNKNISGNLSLLGDEI